MASPLRLAAAAAAAALAAAAAPYAVVHSVLLTDAVETHGARCLDGSPQRYWLSPATNPVNATRWSLHHMGGGWCTGEDDCADRAWSPSCIRGSSNHSCYDAANNKGNAVPGQNYSDPWDLGFIPSALGARWAGGLLNSDPAANPTAHDWNKVWVQYCDGGSFTGNNATPASGVYNGAQVPLYYRGAANLAAVLDDLKANHGLGAATHVVVSGDSAGGLASYMHVDAIADALPSALVVGAPDSGYFYYDPSYPAWGAELRWVIAQGNGTGGLNAACVAARLGAGGDPADCAFPDVGAAYVRSPLFVVNSRFDPALDTIVGGEGGGNATNVQRLGDRLWALVNATVLERSPVNAAFLTSCHQHCGQWGPPGFNVTIDGYTASAAFDEWFRAVAAGQTPPRRVWVQGAQYPCAQCCSGGQH